MHALMWRVLEQIDYHNKSKNKMKPTFFIILKFCHYSQMRCDLSMLPKEGSVCLPGANELEFEDKYIKAEFRNTCVKGNFCSSRVYYQSSLCCGFSIRKASMFITHEEIARQ